MSEIERRWCGISVQHEPHDDRPDGAPACPGWGRVGELGRELEALRKGAERLRRDLDRAKRDAKDEGHGFVFGYLSEAVRSFLRTTAAREAEAHQSDQA